MSVRNSSRSLKRFLTINFLMVAILPILAMALFSLYFLRSHLEDNIAAGNLILARSFASEVDIFLQEPLSLLRQVDKVRSHEHLFKDEDIDTYLTIITSSYLYFDKIQIVDQQGTVVHVSQGQQEELGTSVTGHSFFKETLIRNQPYWSSTFISLQTGKPTVTVTLPMKNGMVVGYLNLDVLSSLANKFQIDEDNYMVVTDQYGVVIAHRDENMVSQRFDLRNLIEIQEGLSGHEGTFRRFSGVPGGHEELASVAIAPATDWLVVYAQSVRQAYAPLYKLGWLNLIILGSTIILTLTVAIYCLQKVFQPLSTFIQSTKGIAEGNYETELPTGFTEINELGKHFGAMAKAVKRRENELQGRLEFEAMVAQISATFINLPTYQWQDGIVQALHRVGTFLEVERAAIFLSSSDGDIFSCYQEWCTPGTASVIDNNGTMAIADYPWFQKQFNEQRVLNVVQMENLPEAAKPEKEYFGKYGIQSLLCLPMVKGGKLTGFLRFDQMRHKTEWPVDIVALLQLLADLLYQTIHRQKSEQELERLQLAIEQANEFILVLDLSGRILYANSSFSRVSGFAANKELEGQFFASLPPAGVEAEIFNEIWAENLVKHGWHGRLSGQTAAGSTLQQEFTLSPLTHSGTSVVAYVMVGRDITKQLEMESQLQQTQKMESIGTLAGGIAHDFNNILSAISGYTELAALGLDADHPCTEYLAEVAKASNRATDLVAQILTFSRKEQQELLPIRIQPIIKEPLKLLRASIPTTIEIVQHIEDTGRVLADPTLLHQVMMNICTNASHAMSDGGLLEVSLQEVVLSTEDVSSLPGLSPGSFARLTISDNGCGINSKIKDKIFEPYFTTKEKGKGTGLGLAVVRGIVQSFNGAITMNSHLGQGTTFTIYLPVLVEKTVHEETNHTGIDQTFMGQQEQILIVDDEEPLVRLLTEVLGIYGYRATGFTSSPQALADFTTHPEKYDVVVSDMTMPGMTGLQLAAEIRKLGSTIPFIISTGYSEGLNQKKIDEVGIAKVLIKPVTPAELSLEIQKLLS